MFFYSHSSWLTRLKWQNSKNSLEFWPSLQWISLKLLQCRPKCYCLQSKFWNELCRRITSVGVRRHETKAQKTNKQQTTNRYSNIFTLPSWMLARASDSRNEYAGHLEISTFEAKHVNSKAERLPMYKTKAVLVKRIDGFHIDSVEENFKESRILYFIKGASPHSHPQLPSE